MTRPARTSPASRRRRPCSRRRAAALSTERTGTVPVRLLDTRGAHPVAHERRLTADSEFRPDLAPARPARVRLGRQCALEAVERAPELGEQAQAGQRGPASPVELDERPVDVDGADPGCSSVARQVSATAPALAASVHGRGQSPQARLTERRRAGSERRGSRGRARARHGRSRAPARRVTGARARPAGRAAARATRAGRRASVRPATLPGRAGADHPWTAASRRRRGARRRQRGPSASAASTRPRRPARSGRRGSRRAARRRAPPRR